jgi:hypothetical protein
MTDHQKLTSAAVVILAWLGTVGIVFFVGERPDTGSVWAQEACSNEAIDNAADVFVNGISASLPPTVPLSIEDETSFRSDYEQVLGDHCDSIASGDLGGYCDDIANLLDEYLIGEEEAKDQYMKGFLSSGECPETDEGAFATPNIPAESSASDESDSTAFRVGSIVGSVAFFVLLGGGVVAAIVFFTRRSRTH